MAIPITTERFDTKINFTFCEARHTYFIDKYCSMTIIIGHHLN